MEKKPLKTPIAVHLDPDQHRKVAQQAKQLGTSKSTWLRMAVLRALAEQRKEAA